MKKGFGVGLCISVHFAKGKHEQLGQYNESIMKRYVGIWKAVIVLFILVNLSISQSAFAQKFTIAIFPDSQYAVSDKPSLFTRQMQWLTEKKDSLNLPFVLHVGDVVNYDSWDQFAFASEAFKILDDANVNYAITIGNHDTEAVNVDNGSAAPGDTRINIRKTAKFNTAFPVERFKAQRGRFEEGKSDNAYYTFKAGGLNWLVITLEFCARSQVVAWANTIVPQFPDHNVIFLTHVHLNSNGQVEPGAQGYGATSPNEIFFNLMRKHANVRLVFCGHFSGALSKHRNDPGEKGNRIYQMLQDYSTERNAHGNGYLRLVDIDPAAGTIDAKIYSPVLNSTRNDVSKFSYTGVQFVQPAVTGIGDQIEIGSKSLDLRVSSGSPAENFSAEILSSSDKEVSLTLSTMMGQKVSSLKVDVLPNMKSKIGLDKFGISSLAPGIYLLSAYQENNLVSKKFVVYK